MVDGADAATVDSTPTKLLGGRLLLRQPRTGHRVGTDAVLLAAAVTPRPGETILDVGSGVGSVGLAVALRNPLVQVRLLEIAPASAALARDNAVENGFAARVTIEQRDVLARAAPDGRPGADWVVSNPPFQMAEHARPSPDAARAGAHTLPPGRAHGDWLHAMLSLVRPGGAVVLIHRPDALPALLAAAAGRLGGVCVLPVLPRDEAPAIRILFAGVAGSRAPFTLLPPLVLHGADGRFLPKAAALHEGTDALSLVHTAKSRPRRPAFARSD